MASAHDETEEIIEGLLCSICIQEFPSIPQLKVHFEQEHEFDKDGIQSLKGLYNKAKKMFLKDEDNVDARISPKFLSAFPNSASYEENNPWDWETSSSLPLCRSHKTFFKKVRSTRIDSFAAETNKLLIRLDKLLTNMPTDPVKRKVHEKNIVPWAKDDDVPLCPFCAKGFNIGRRRHHCRLCGAIMCDECSENLAQDFAEKLASIVHVGNHKNHSIAHHSSSADNDKISSNSLGSILGGISTLRRSGSQGSLNSIFTIVDSIGREPGLRICSHCMKCLITRNQQLNRKTSKPLLQVYYSKLMDTRKHMDELVPQFIEMCNSLNSGESTFDLKEAEQLRIKILKLSDIASMTAQKIRDLGQAGVSYEENERPTEDGSPLPAGARQEVLQRRIHSATVSFLKENVLALPKVPTPQQFAERKQLRMKEAETRLMNEREAERRAALHMRKGRGGEESPRGTGALKNSGSSSSSLSQTSSGISTPLKKPTEEVVLDSGWCPDLSVQNVTETDDPIVQQMNIIRNSIQQAKSVGRLEEVSILENNLKELQSVFKRNLFLQHP